MVVKYIANDGTEFNNEIDCKNYEKNSRIFDETVDFIVEYITVDEDKKIYIGSGEDFELANFITCTYTFRITAGYNNWNEFVSNYFQYLDDDIYYSYEVPIILDEQINQWLGYAMSKDIQPFDDLIEEVEGYAQLLKDIKKAL